MKRGYHSAVSPTGLGLAITKQIVTLHGGTVLARSMNNGVQFTMTLPG